MQITVTELNELLPIIIPREVIGVDPKAIDIKGPPGIGKSDIAVALKDVLSARDGHEWGLFEINCAQFNLNDLLGYLTFEDNPDGTRRSVWSEPSWARDRKGKGVNDYKRILVVMDEYGQGELDFKRASAQLKLKGQLGPFQLPPGAVVISVSNHAAGRNGVTKSFDFEINRRVELHVIPDRAGWMKYANKAGIHPAAITFAEKHPEIVFGTEEPKEQGPWCTARSLVLCTRDLQTMAQNMNPDAKNPPLPHDGLAFTVMCGWIGEAAAQQWAATLLLQREAATMDEVVADPKKAKVPTDLSALTMTVYSLAYDTTKDNLVPVMAYMDRLPADFTTTFVTAIVERNPQFIVHPALKQFMAKHKDMIFSAALAGRR